MVIVRPSALIIKNGKILVVKSKYGNREFYLLPGGGIEGLESLEQTAVREVKEETNLDIKITGLFCNCEWIDKKRGKHVSYVVLKGKILGGFETHLYDSSKNDHVRGVEWLSIKQLKERIFYPSEILSLIEKSFKEKL